MQTVFVHCMATAPNKEVGSVTTRSYEIRIRGQIPVDELIEFDNLTAQVEPPRTVLRGVVPDRLALQAILERLHGLGLELTELRRIPVVNLPVTACRSR